MCVCVWGGGYVCVCEGGGGEVLRNVTEQQCN